MKMRICQSCGDEYEGYDCSECKLNPPRCPECHAELEHGQLPAPQTLATRNTSLASRLTKRQSTKLK